MDTQHLYYFLTVADLGNITLAASKLHMTQPALSKMIKRIEDELGTPLFQRLGNKIVLNDCGRAFRSYAEESLQRGEILHRRLKDIQAQRRDSVLLGYSFPPGEPTWMHEGLHRFVRDNPDVALSITQLSTDTAGEFLRSGRVNLAVTMQPFPSADIIWQQTHSDALGILVSSEHPLARKEKVWLKDIRHERLYCPDRNNEMGTLIREHCHRAGFDPDIVYEGPHTIMNEQIWNGMGISVMSLPFYWIKRPMFNDTYTNPRIVFRKLCDPFCVRTAGIAMLRDAELSGATQQLYDTLLRFAANHTQYHEFVEDGPAP